MRVLRSLSLVALLVPGLLAAPVLTPAAGASGQPVAPVVQELPVSGVDAAAAQSSAPAGVTGALVMGDDRRTVLLTPLLDTRPFALVGVTWDAEPPAGQVDAYVRTRTDGVWSGWEALGGLADEEPDPASRDTERLTRVGTSPLWVGEADGVQARVDVLSGADPQGLRLSLVDPGSSPADEVDPAALRTASGGAPVIRTRAEWGADESLRGGSPAYASRVRAVTLHHTASSNDYAAEDVPRLLRGFYAYHVKAQGWSDIGYNFLVDRFGRIWEGRAGGTNRAVIGAHAGGFNTGTVGISMIGTYENVAPSPTMLESVAQLAAWRLSSAGVDPRSTVSLTSAGSTRYAAGKVVQLPALFAHRQVSTTACPGARGIAALPGLTERAAALAAGAAPYLPAPSSVEISGPASVAAGATVQLTVTGGRPGSTVEVWFAKRSEEGWTKRRDGAVSSAGSYRTSFVADQDYRYFAVVDGLASPRRSTRVTPAAAAPASVAPAVLRVQGPVTVPHGEQVVVTARGPAGTAVSLWFRREGDAAFVQRRTGVLDATGTFTTTYTNDVPHEYFVRSATLASEDAETLVGEVPNGLDIWAPAAVEPGRVAQVIVQGTPGQAVEVWFARRGETSWNRRREAVLGRDGTFRTSFVGNDEYRYFAVSGGRTSKRVRTTLSRLPAAAPAAAPKLDVAAPPAVDAGAPVDITVTGTPGAAVDLWFRRRGSEVWSRLREGRFDATGQWKAQYVGVDDHEYWASSGGFSSVDLQTLTVPVVSGPPRARLGQEVELTGRARPGDTVVVEKRRRGSSLFSGTTLVADRSGVFSTRYAADDEYEYRATVESRVGAVRRTTVSPTVQAVGQVRRGAPVTLSGTARPGSTVEVLFRRDGAPSFGVAGRRDRGLPVFSVGRTVTAGPDGRWSVGVTAYAPLSWYARADGNATSVQGLTLLS